MAPLGIPLLDPVTFVVQTINGLQAGLLLFLVASGLTVILGILDVLNLAHGEMYALGTYIMWTVLGFLMASVMAAPQAGADPVSLALFLGLVLVAALITAIVMFPIGAIMESVFIRPIYERDQVYQLVLTFALLSIIADLMEVRWGGQALDFFSAKLAIGQIPAFELIGLGSIPTTVAVVMVASLVVAGSLFYFFNRTKLGRIIRATAIDREMAQAVGVSPDRVFTLVFAFGAFLVGFAGGMQFVLDQARTGFGATALVQSFVVIVIGGLGSLHGALVGAIIVGVTTNWMSVLFPNLQQAAPFIVMVIVLLVKPEGLFGTWGELE